MLKRLSSASLRGALLFFLSASVCVGANDADPPVNIFPSQTAATMILETMPPELRETVSKPSPQASHEANVVKAPEPEPGPPFEVSGENGEGLSAVQSLRVITRCHPSGTTNCWRFPVEITTR